MLSGVCVWVFVILYFKSVSVQSYSNCPQNEVEVECVNPCNNCEKRGRCTEPPPCRPGCDCKRGFFRDGRRRCIPEQECKSYNHDVSYSKCPVNEVKVDCVNPCNNCEQRGRCIGRPACYPGCDCKRGFFRHRWGRCIPERKCKTKKCTNNAVFLQCGLGCEPTCANPFPDHCSEECVAGCFCLPGFLKNEKGDCVHLLECDYFLDRSPNRCAEDEQYYYECTPSCKNTCENYNNPEANCGCNPPGCFCADGLVMRSDGLCVFPQECSKTPGKCLPDEEYYDYMPDCKNTCENFNNPGIRCPPGLPGCFCKEGLVKDNEGRCVNPKEGTATEKCPPNEQYYDYIPNCKNTCENYNNPGVRCSHGPPGCFCREGLVKRKDGECVPPQYCQEERPPPCPEHAIFIPCGPACPPTCEDRYPGPCKEECYPACYCKPGYLKKDERCVPKDECDPKEPPGKCPPDEQYYEYVPSCKNTCEHYNNSDIQCYPGPPGCFCKEGLVKRKDGKCVNPRECPVTCPPDEQFYEYVPCKNPCEHYNNSDIQCYPGPGCFCKEGLVKRKDGKCVNPRECPVTCPPDEQFYEYVPCKNTCEHYNSDIQCYPGPPGCFCKEGLVKRKDGKCVNPRECPSKCLPDEQYYEHVPNCKNTCEHYNNPGIRCKPGPPGCFCKEGLVKRKDGKCVNPRECPGKCSPYEQYYEYVPSCRNTCEHYNNPDIRCKPGPPGCFCKEGLVKRKDGKCVNPRECPAVFKCPKGEQYYDYTPNCKNTCEHYNNPGVRCQPGPAGCFCKVGLVKRKDGRCVNPRECTVKCSTDEQYYDQVPSCKNTCEHYNDPRIWCPPGSPGCFCKEGLVKRKDGKCVKPRECPVKPPPTCPENEVFIPCGPACPATCLDKHPQPCKERCVPACFCKPGSVRNKENKCVYVEDCEPTSKCPPDEQYYDHMPNCKNTCEHYNNPGIRCPAGPAGCFCKEGLVKRKDGKCVNPRDCVGTCHPDEEYYSYMPNCTNTCENYNKPVLDCPLGQPGCFCRKGLVKRKDGRCVHPRRCIDQCLPSEQYYENMPNCKNTCENFYRPVICPLGPPGCFCRKGLLKRNDGRCVLPRRCQEITPKCPENAVFVQCASACPATCQVPYPGPCEKPCIPRCVCNRGFLQEKDGKCVDPSKCKPTNKCTAPGEEFQECGSPCPRTCENRIQSMVSDECNKCMKGCFCKAGLLRTKEGACVRPENCP